MAMMPRCFIWILIACLLLNALVPAFAQDDEEEDSATFEDPTDLDTEDEDLPPVSAVTIFPDYADRKFASGVTVEALIGFQNNNENAFHVEYIRGSLTIPTGQFTYRYLQNFSGAMYNTTVGSGDEACLLYRFEADTSIGPSEYGLIIELYYSNDDNETYLSTVYNGTVVLLDADASMDGKGLFALTMILVGLGSGAYFVYGSMTKTIKKQAPRGRKEEKEAPPATTNVSKDGIDWDFVPKEHQNLAEKRSGGSVSPTRKVSPRKGRSSPSRSSPSRRESD